MSSYATTMFAWFLLLPVDPPSTPQAVDSPPSTTVINDDAQRAALLYEEAREHYQEGRLREAAVRAVDSYRLLDLGRKYGDVGLAVLADATIFHLEAYDETDDPVFLARIQMELEDFTEHHETEDSDRVDELRRQLHTVRNERLKVAQQYADRGDHLRAAVEAGSCFAILSGGDKSEAIGRRAAIAASKAYREAWNIDNDIAHLKKARRIMDEHLEQAGDRATRAALQERRLVGVDLGFAQVRGGALDPGDSAPTTVITRQDRGFIFASGAALGGAAVLSVGAALWGRNGFIVQPAAILGEDGTVVGSARDIVPSAVFFVAAGATSGLAIHGMIDAGYIPARERKIIAISCTALGLVGVGVGASLLATGLVGAGDSGRRRSLANGGLGLMTGLGAPLGTGISALISRRGGAR